MKYQIHQCKEEKYRALRKEKAKSKSGYLEGVNKLTRRNKEKKNGIQTNGNDQDSVIIVD